MTTHDESDMQRGEEARQILSHPLLVEAFEVLEQEITERWSNSPARDAEGREKLWTTLKLLHRLQAQLTSVVETGQIARATIAQRLGLKPSEL